MLDERSARLRTDPGAGDESGPTTRKLRLLISCPDRKGLVAAISSFFERHGGNILRIDQGLRETNARHVERKRRYGTNGEVVVPVRYGR